ncbi:hypothetical protein SZ64_04010 [Erythrobacter sp. SG61-1L]|nr:hypothetical protein SZ64_04010 [Erythrobacter sp. SG61-1L]
MAAAATIVVPMPTGKDAQHVMWHAGKGVDTHNRWAAAVLDMWVGPDGKVVSCGISRFLGSEGVADGMCAAMIGRKLGGPKDIDGNKSYALVRSSFAIFPDSQRHKLSEFNAKVVDLMAEGNRKAVSPGQHSPGPVYLRLMIGKDGKLAACQADKDVATDAAGDACAAISSIEFEPRVDEAGNPVSYVGSETVEFVTNADPAPAN